MSQDTGAGQKSADKTTSSATGRSSRTSSPYFWAVAFGLLIAGWMLSGLLQSNEAGSVDQKQKSETTDSKGLFRVQVETFMAETRTANLIIRGRTEVDARVSIKAETAGMVVHAPMKKGTWVKKGDLLCRIETADRDAALLQAKARLAQAEADYSANTALALKGHTAQLKVTSFKAQLDAAKAELKRAELDLERTSIEAPFNGFVEEQPAKVGDYLTTGTTCATLVALDPLIVVGTVSELEVVNLKVGMKSTVTTVNDEKREGKIRFISSSADTQTRTFRVEIEITNKDAHLRDGLTADLNIPLQETRAHRFSPALLVLDDTGQIGVRTVGEDNLVKFIPVKILSDSPTGVWVSGLPEKVRVITAGHEYVAQGQKVHVTEKVAGKGASAGQGS